MADRLDDLEAKAKAATPGPWAALDTAIVSDNPEVPDDGDTYDFGSACVVDYAPYHEQAGAIPHAPNAAFIAAADPQTVLDLVAALRAERARADRLEGALRRRRFTAPLTPHEIAVEACLLVEVADAREAR